MENKERVQLEALFSWRDASFKGSLIMPTGSGKTRCLVLAAGKFIRENPGEKWLVIVPTTRLKTNEIPEEFKKWGYYNEFIQGVTVECIQTAYKRRGNHFNGVCVDEVDTTLSPEYSLFYKNNTYDKLLGLTATTPEGEYLDILNKYAPICFHKTVKQALELGLIAPHIVYNIPVEFTPREKLLYESVDKKTRWCIANYGVESSYKLISKRKLLCYNSVNKIKVISEIIKKFSNRKAIVFSESIEFAESVQRKLGDICVTFHSKLTKKERLSSIKLLADDRTKQRVISTAKALDRGANLSKLNLCIISAGTSKQRQFIQRQGRGVRLSELEDIAYIINLYVKDTVEEGWVIKRTQGLNSKWITNLNQINYDIPKNQ